METTWYYQRAVRMGKILSVVILLALGACKDDDKKAEPSTRELLIGTWEMVEAEIDGEFLGPEDLRIEAVFQSDGDYRETIIEDGFSETYYGEWEVIDDEIQLEYDDGDSWELDIVSISKDKLRVVDGFDFEALFEKQ